MPAGKEADGELLGDGVLADDDFSKLSFEPLVVGLQLADGIDVVGGENR